MGRALWPTAWSHYPEAADRRRDSAKLTIGSGAHGPIAAVREWPRALPSAALRRPHGARTRCRQTSCADRPVERGADSCSMRTSGGASAGRSGCH